MKFQKNLDLVIEINALRREDANARLQEILHKNREIFSDI